MKTAYQTASLITLHIEFGGQFVSTAIRTFGVEAWNKWMWAMVERIPMSWMEGEHEPPAHLWFDAEASDFSGMSLDGVDFGLVVCDGVKFDGAHAVGALFGDCRGASFRHCDLRDSTFVGDISGAQFDQARMVNASFVDSWYSVSNPPLGLTETLLNACASEPDDDPLVVEGNDHPVQVKAHLAEAAHR